MILEQLKLENGAEIALWDITETEDELLDILELNPFVIEEISHFSSSKRRLEYLASRCALNHLAGESKFISYLPSRRPYLADKTSQLSITHTGHYAAVITHRNREVGIDIERISDKVARVKAKFLSETELSHIDEKSEKTQLTILWAAKEAIYKVLGIEVIDFIKDINIQPFQPYLDGEIIADVKIENSTTEYNLTYKVYPEFVMVWVIK